MYAIRQLLYLRQLALNIQGFQELAVQNSFSSRKAKQESKTGSKKKNRIGEVAKATIFKRDCYRPDAGNNLSP